MRYLFSIAAIILFYAQQVTAQSSNGSYSAAITIFDKKDDIDLSWDTPGYSNKGDNQYWIEKDTLYKKGDMVCASISLADIDLANKNISQHKRVAIAGTGKKVYSLFLHPVKGKKTFSGFCIMNNFSATRPSDDAMELYLADQQQAEDAFAYLQNQSETVKFLAELSAFLEDDGNSPQAPSTDDFDSQLLTLINGVKDNYQSLNDGMIKQNEYKCKVQLQGSKRTYIYSGMLGNVSLIADFGEFATYEEAQKEYEEVKAKVSASKKMPCTMAVTEEIVTEMGRNQGWIPFDISGTLDPALKDLLIETELIASKTFTKDYKMLDVYLVILRIKKQ